MPVYQYSAMDSSGMEQKGTKEAANEAELTAFLKEQGMFPTSIKLARGAKTTKKAAGSAGGQAPLNPYLQFRITSCGQRW